MQLIGRKGRDRMLHVSSSNLSGSHRPVASGAQGDRSLDLAQIYGILRRQWRVIALLALVSLALASAYVFAAPPRYTATAALMLDTRRVQLFQQQSVLSDVSFDAVAIESQLELLRSRAIATSVINNLELLKDAEFTGNVTSFFASINVAVGNLFGVADDKERLDPNALMEQAIKRFSNNLTITRAARSYVISISFTSLDEKKAASIANAVGEAYILDQVMSKHTTTKDAAAWLQERIGELREKAADAERAALEFRNKNNMVDSGGRLLSEQQLTEINTQLVLAKSRTAEAKARLDRILELLERGPGDAAMVDTLQNTVHAKLQQQYVDAARREAEFSARYGADHPAVISIRKDMETIRRVSRDEVTRIAETLNNEYEIARGREEALLVRLNELTGASIGTREAQVRLRSLESSANAYRVLHDNFLQRFVETSQQQSFPSTAARLITEAVTADKTHPKTILVLALASVLGIALGCGAAFAREGLDHPFRTSRQVEDVLGVGCIGVMPAVANQPTKLSALPEPTCGVDGDRVIAPHVGMARQVVLTPHSRFAETIRSIMMTVDQSSQLQNIKVIGITSAMPAEGKSTVSANLAQLMGHSGRRALLIDGDLRHSALTRRLAPDADVGLLEVLNRNAELSKSVWRDPVTGLDFLPTVLKAEDVREVAVFNHLGKLLEAARATYDYVVVDFPPLASVAAAKAAAQHIDAFILVIAWGETSPMVALEALNSAEVVHSKIIGAVLNRAHASKLKKLEAYKGRRYHNYYESSYVADRQ